MILNWSEHSLKIWIHGMKFLFRTPWTIFFHAYGENTKAQFSCGGSSLLN